MTTTVAPPMLYQDQILPLELIYCPRIVAPWPQRAESMEDLLLQRSLDVVGLLHNVLVVPTGDERYALIAGRRRYEAARALGWEFLSCKIISGQVSTHRLFTMFLAENLHRLHLGPASLEIARDIEASALERLTLEDRRECESHVGPYLWPGSRQEDQDEPEGTRGDDQ